MKKAFKGLNRGQRTFFLLVVMFLGAAVCTRAADDPQNTPSFSPGDIVVSATGEGGAVLEGVRVRLILPGGDGSLDIAPNILFESTDGDKFDGYGVRKGAVVFILKDISDYVGAESDVSLDISLKGYVPLQDLLHVYHKDNINAVSVQLQKQKSGH